MSQDTKKKKPVILIHGYSDKGVSFQKWAKVLKEARYQVTEIHTANYETLTNEVTIKDIAEAFDRAIRIRAGLNKEEEFDAIVHSTGMLVMRAWLSTYASRRSRLKSLIALAPATFGSPLAEMGRSWLGAMFKGNKRQGPDFMEAGDCVLDALELGSKFTWDLAHVDLIGKKPQFGLGSETPYVFVFGGTDGYGGLKLFINPKGSDGTVRWSGMALNSRKIDLDLTVEPGSNKRERFKIAPWSNIDIPWIPVEKTNHQTILEDPNGRLIKMVLSALEVDNEAEFKAWYQTDEVIESLQIHNKLTHWQQFLMRVVDERGDSVPDYFIQLCTESDGELAPLDNLDWDIHHYTKDRSFACFHVNLDKLQPGQLPNLWLRLIASSGSQLVDYHGYGSEKINKKGIMVNPDGVWDAELDISKLLQGYGPDNVHFFYPFTTTLIEIKLNREPMPIQITEPNRIFQLIDSLV